MFVKADPLLGRQALQGRCQCEEEARRHGAELHHWFWILSDTFQILLQEFGFCLVWKKHEAPWSQ